MMQPISFGRRQFPPEVNPAASLLATERSFVIEAATH
jgi:hypothetical protein